MGSVAGARSPRMRGWTVGHWGPRVLDPAFPVHAEMNRSALSLLASRVGVPRVCGDEPTHLACTIGMHLRSPRMRG